MTIDYDEVRKYIDEIETSYLNRIDELEKYIAVLKKRLEEKQWQYQK